MSVADDRQARADLPDEEARRTVMGLGILIGVIRAVVAAAAWAVAPIHSDSNEQVYVIPKETWEHRQARPSRALPSGST